MVTTCSSDELLSSSNDRQSGYTASAINRSVRRSASMAELTNNRDTSLFPAVSNEHILFAGTLRNWGDRLLQGQQPTRVPLCPRCVTCRCESLKDLPNPLLNSHYHHHRPSCPNYHQHEHSKISSGQRLVNIPKRRANSCDSSILLNSHTSLIKQRAEHSPSPPPTRLSKQKRSISKIPVRISSATSSSTIATTASEYSPSSSINECRSLNINTKIPRPISNPNLSIAIDLSHKNQTLSTSNEDLDQDSLNDNAHQRISPMPNHESYIEDISSEKKKKNMMMMYCMTTNTNDIDFINEEILMKKKTTMSSPSPSLSSSSSSSKSQSLSDSSSEKKQRKFWHKEGRHSKSKSAATPSLPPNTDLSSTTSSSSSSSPSISNTNSPSHQLRKKSRSYVLASPSQSKQIPSISDDSLSERSERLSKKRRPRSAFISYESAPRSTRFQSTSPVPPPPPSSSTPSVYLIELKNNNRPTNPFGLTKTITYVWKSGQTKKNVQDLKTYPRYSIEQVPPIIDQNKRTIPISSRHIILQRGTTDYWQNMKTSPDSILTSSCQKHTGSATDLLSPTIEIKQNDYKRRPNSNGNVISITTTKRRQPSLLNQSQNTQWNIEGDGKQLRYSNLKWYSVDHLQKDNQAVTRQRIKRKQSSQQQQRISDSTTDTGSSSEQHNRSAPPILQQNSNLYLTNDIHEVFESTSMNKQTESIIPDYTLFHREINDTSSPINYDQESQEQQQLQQTNSSPSSSSSSSSSKEIQHYETIIDEYSLPPPPPPLLPSKTKLNSYASTDEDVDEFNLDYSEDIDRSTIQTYRDRLDARLNREINLSYPRKLSTEFSQITLDSGVDILSEQKISQPKIDEHYSEQTTNHHDLFALSDDSLLDIESPQINDLLLKTPPTINEQNHSFTDENDEFKTYLSTITDYPLVNKNERGLSNTSEQYFSADSELNTSASFPTNDPYSGYELENISDEDENLKSNEENNKVSTPEKSPPKSPKFEFKLPTFGDWIDQVFTTFLAETNQQSTSTSRSSSMISIHTSQNTIDTSSSQLLTVIENNQNNQNLTIISKTPIVLDENNQINSLHRRSLSWPNDEQQVDEQNFKDMSSSSLNHENLHTIDANDEKIDFINDENLNKQSKSLLLSSIENDDEEMINEETMQNNHIHHYTTSTDHSHSNDENFSLSNPTINIETEKVEEKERSNDEKHTEIGAENDNKNDKPLIQLPISNESSIFSFYDVFHSYEPHQHPHTNSHDSLLQTDLHIMNNINTTASSTDDLSTTHPLSSSVFHSKDSALGLSDDNLNCLQTNQFIIMDDDNGDDDNDEDHDQQQQEQQILSSTLSSSNQYDQTIENNVIQDNANNNINKNELTYDFNKNNNKNSHINNNKMLWINEQSKLISPSYITEHNERTISSSSSEQLIPKEKQTGMYLRVFGSSAAIHLAEKYNCEWLEDVTTPTNSIRKRSTTVENDELSNSRIFHQHQSIGDDDEFVVTFQSLQPSYSCPNLNSSIIREPLRERSYSLTTLDAYARLDITRDILEQIWLSLLDLAFSDKDDIESGEKKLHHIRVLSDSYINMNETLIEKSRSHGDIFSTANHNQNFTAKKSKSFDITSLPKPSSTTTTTTDESANVGLLQGAAISEPFIDRILSASIHSDTEPNLLDNDHDNDDNSMQSLEEDNLQPEEEYSPINQITPTVIKEPLNYVFHYPHHLDHNEEFDLEPEDNITNYLPERNFISTDTFGEEDKELYMTLVMNGEAPAVPVQQRTTQEILAEYRPHSLSTIPSSRASQYASSLDDSDDVIDLPAPIRTSILSVNQDEHLQFDHSEDDEDDKEEIETDSSSSQSRPLSPIQDYPQIKSELNQQIKLTNFSDIDHQAWEQSLSEPTYSADLSIQHNHEQDLFTFADNLTTILLKDPIESSQKSITDQTELTETQNHFIEQINENNLIDFSTQEDMDSQHDNKSIDSTHTSISSIHDTHLDANELAYRLARLDPLTISSPPKLTFADELAELGEKEDRFENDSLDHSPAEHVTEKEQNESLVSTPHTYPTTPSPLRIDELTFIAKEIRDINQEKSISSLCTIVEDIHAQTNNQYLTKIFDYHHSPPIANLQTIITELHQTPIGKSIPRPQRPTHLQLDQQEHEYEQEKESIQSPVIIDDIPISSNIINDLEQHLASYKTKTPSPPPQPSVPTLLPMTRRISEPPIHSTRYRTNRIDKVSDLEIVKQGKGFKIGYVDRQGTDQRVILTKRIEAGPDIMARDPHVRLPYKGRKILNQIYSSVLYTNGYNTIQEDKKFQHSADDIEVPVIGTNPQHFDESDMISIDIDGPSTMLNSICESVVITQGSFYTINPPKLSIDQPISQRVPKSIFDNNLSPSSSSRLRHVVLDQHEEYLLDSSKTPSPSNKQNNKIEVIDTWQDRTVINGSGTTWRSPSLQSSKATKHIQPSHSAQQFTSINQPNMVQMRIASSHDVKYRTSEHIEIPAVYDWNDDTVDTPKKYSKTTRDIALSPILMEKKNYQTSSTSPLKSREKIDRSCQYSPPAQHDFASQFHFENLTSSTQVTASDIPNFLISHGGTQTINDSNPIFDDSGIQTHIQTISPSLSIASSENQPTTQPFTLSGSDFIRKLNEQRTHASALTVTQYTDDNYYLPSTDNTQTTNNLRPTTLERSADSGILVDDQSLRNRPAKANFSLQVDIKGSSSDSEDVSEVTQRPVNRIKSSINGGDMYEHHSELLITSRHSSKSRQNSSSNDKRLEQTSAKEIEQQILQLRRERSHILDLLSLNWNRSNIWVELTEAKLNYIIGETDALLRSLSFDASPNDSERVKLKMHQYEEEMAELTRQRLAVYRERLEDSKKQLDMKIDELELKKSSNEYSQTSHYSTLDYTPRVNNHTKHSKSFLSTSAENLTNMPLQETISSHPHLLDISFLTSTPSNQTNGLPPRYPRSARYHQPDISSRTVYRPTPRYPSTTTTTTTLSNEHRYDYPRYRTASYVTPSGNLSGMQGLSKSQQAILDETDKLVKDSQQFHSESASQFERARESLLSSETPIRLARANMAASRLSPNPSYLPTDVTLAELFKYEQSLAKETAKNTRAYSSLSTSAES